MRVSRKPTVEALIARLARGGFAAPATPLAGGAGGGFDHGRVTALPASPGVGDLCRFLADKTNGIVWSLEYDGEGTYPWKKIGGPPLYKLGANQEWSDTTIHTTTASLTAPLAMQFIVDSGAQQIQNQSGELTASEVGLYVGGVAAGVSNSVVTRNLFEQLPCIVQYQPVTAAKGTTIDVRVQNVQAKKVSFRGPYLRIDPIRVG